MPNAVTRARVVDPWSRLTKQEQTFRATSSDTGEA